MNINTPNNSNIFYSKKGSSRQPQLFENDIWKRLGLSLAAFVSDLSGNSFPEAESTFNLKLPTSELILFPSLPGNIKKCFEF